MKKVLFTVAMFSICSIITAQENTSTTTAVSDFKPEAGANNLEINFTPLGNTPISITNFRYRRFLSETAALRLGFGISLVSSSNEEVLKPTVGSDIIKRSKVSSFGWNIKPGYEMHFEGTKRLSPYVGGELAIASQTSKTVSHSLSATNEVIETTIKNANPGYIGFFSIGANALAGFDFYVAKHLYMGAEMGFGFSYISNYKRKTTSSPAPVTAVKDADQGRSFTLAPNYNGGIRVGYIF
jgi:hypothetical protein